MRLRSGAALPRALCRRVARLPADSTTNTATGVAPFDGNLARNSFRGPNFREVDLSLFKNIKATERVNFQFRAEGFNIFNRTNLYQPYNQFGNPTLFGLSQKRISPGRFSSR